MCLSCLVGPCLLSLSLRDCLSHNVAAEVARVRQTLPVSTTTRLCCVLLIHPNTCNHCPLEACLLLAVHVARSALVIDQFVGGRSNQTTGLSTLGPPIPSWMSLRCIAALRIPLLPSFTSSLSGLALASFSGLGLLSHQGQTPPPRSPAS